MGKKNKVVKLTERKVRYIIRAKKRGDSTKRIAEDMKLSPSSVKRFWMEWTKTKMLLVRDASSPAANSTPRRLSTAFLSFYNTARVP
jgi:FixJ family two-component response regulator